MLWETHSPSEWALPITRPGLHSSRDEARYNKFLNGSVDLEELQQIEDFYRNLRVLGEKHGFSIYVVIFPVLKDLLEIRSRIITHLSIMFVPSWTMHRYVTLTAFIYGLHGIIESLHSFRTIGILIHLVTKSSQMNSLTLSLNSLRVFVNTPPAKAGGFSLRLKTGLIDPA